MPKKLALVLLVVLLVVLILLLVIPLGIGTAMGVCSGCATPHMPSGLATCVVLAAGLLVAASMFKKRLHLVATGPPALVLVRSLDRPPRSI